jgi:hypothetical protein
MGKTNKSYRSSDEKQHHVSKVIKKEVAERSVKHIDRALKNKKYDQFYDELDIDKHQESWNEQ